MTNAAEARPPHPVELEVAYPERLSRGLIFVKWLLIIPHLIAIYLLLIAVFLLTIFAWFGILFTGRYPKAFFPFTTGVMRWAANVFAYAGLMRDEYPPFSWEPGEYPVALTIPMPERQSRWRLLIRWFAVIPNQIVFVFVQLAWYFTTFIAWWAILFTGRYPRGLFRFSVGVMRWYNRQAAYTYFMRDEYPPYSVAANARPGNEVVSAIIGAPIGFTYAGLYLMFSILPLISGPETVRVSTTLLAEPVALRNAEPHGSTAGVRVTLLAYDDRASNPAGVSSGRPFNMPTAHLESFDVRVEKDGWMPAFYTPLLFTAEPCTGGAQPAYSATFEENDWFDIFFTGGSQEATLYFWVEGFGICRLTYAGTGRPLHFAFE